MKGSKSVFIGLAVVAAIILILVLWIIAIIGAMDLTDGCLYRYNFDDNQSISNASKVTNTITLKANSNYTITTSEEASDGPSLDPNAYGKWRNTNLKLDSNKSVKLTIKGDISLCKAYIPKNNLQSLSNKDKDGKLIAIPRVEEKAISPVSLIFDAKTDEWRNIAEMFENDHVVVSILPDKKTNMEDTKIYDSFDKHTKTIDCRAGKTTYNPACGRYSVWDGRDKYVDQCIYIAECKKDCWWNLINLVCDWTPCYQPAYKITPIAYSNDGEYTAPWSDDINNFILNFNRDCNSEHEYINNGDYQKKKYFWFSADTATGLLTRIDSNLSPSNAKERGGYKFAKILESQSLSEYQSNLDKGRGNQDQSSSNKDKDYQGQSSLTGDEDYKVIFNEEYKQNTIGYLQYRFLNKGSFDSNTGGYVLNIRQTKCRHTNGSSAVGDSFAGRGVVEYVIADYGKNPNNSKSEDLSPQKILADKNGSGEVKTGGDEKGYLWLRIKNKDEDYKDSFGQYQVNLESTIAEGGFYADILNPFFEGLKDKIKHASITIFKNMTCYKGAGGEGNCTNFFSYIKAMLILYVMLYGASFLLGIVKINQTDLVIRVVKISLVAGLLNDKTFEFFNLYVFDTVTNFSDDIISNMSGYSMFSDSTSVSNPFMFLNAVMTKIFLSSTFAGQIMATLSMGFGGLIYFILIFVAICIIVMVLLKAIAIYLMAFMAIAVLIGLAPLFLTFILFERTWYLFDHWLKFMIRYMLEPVIMLAGIIILTQLFTIYLDQVVGYSVCWKCALPIKIPFPSIKGVTPAFLDVELFCINWFAPWGFDYRSTQMGMSMQNMVVLMMLAYCMWGYIDFSSRMVARMAGGFGGPSATSMGEKLAGAVGNKALSKIGLDAKSRQEIKKAARGRLDSMIKGDKSNPLSKRGGSDSLDSKMQKGTSEVRGVKQSNKDYSSQKHRSSSFIDSDVKSDASKTNPKNPDTGADSNNDQGGKVTRQNLRADISGNEQGSSSESSIEKKNDGNIGNISQGSSSEDKSSNLSSSSGSESSSYGSSSYGSSGSDSSASGSNKDLSQNTSDNSDTNSDSSSGENTGSNFNENSSDSNSDSSKGDSSPQSSSDEKSEISENKKSNSKVRRPNISDKIDDKK